jgi:hypothetical protein
MAIIGLFPCDPWCLPTQNWLKTATNDISIQEFHNIITHYKPHFWLIKIRGGHPSKNLGQMAKKSGALFLIHTLSTQGGALL